MGSSSRGSISDTGEERGEDKGSGELARDIGDNGGEEGGRGDDGVGPKLLSLSVSKAGRVSAESDTGVSSSFSQLDGRGSHIRGFE